MIRRASQFIIVAATFAAVASLTVIVLVDQPVLAQSEHEHSEPQMVGSLTDARDVAGFEVKEPDVPDGFDLTSIIIYEPAPGTNVTSSVVHMYWTNAENDEWLLLMQGPELGGLGNSTVERWNGNAVDVAVHPEVDGRPFGILGVGWSGANNDYLLAMPHQEVNLTEVKSVAERVVQSLD